MVCISIYAMSLRLCNPFTKTSTLYLLLRHIGTLIPRNDLGKGDDLLEDIRTARSLGKGQDGLATYTEGPCEEYNGKLFPLSHLRKKQD